MFENKYIQINLKYRTMKKFREFLKDIVTEDVTQPEVQIIPRSGNILWSWMLQPNHNNFIYHFLRNLNGEHTWNKIDKMLIEKIKTAPDKLSSLVSSRIFSRTNSANMKRVDAVVISSSE